MAAPVRLQLSRRKGFDLQMLSRETNGLAAVNVARPTLFGNPVVVNENCTAASAVMAYRRMLKASQTKLAAMIVHADHSPSIMGGLGFIIWREKLRKRIPDLRDKNLACWCKPGEPCHADVLLELANRPTPGPQG